MIRDDNAYKLICELVAFAVVKASSEMSDDKINAYSNAIKNESNANACWVLEQISENARVAGSSKCALCDDTGIPHVFIEVGPKVKFKGEYLQAIQEGVAKGLNNLPARPMAVQGTAVERLVQSRGIYESPAAVLPAPYIIKYIPEDELRIHVSMEGGGPAIRGRVKHVFHRNNLDIIVDEIVEYAKGGVSALGCTPSILAVGIGRSLFEASALMQEAMIYGRANEQSELEMDITRRINEAQIGPLGLGGNSSVLATFLKIGEQRSSGVRIVAIRPCCCIEPRVASVSLTLDEIKSWD